MNKNEKGDGKLSRIAIAGVIWGLILASLFVQRSYAATYTQSPQYAIPTAPYEYFSGAIAGGPDWVIWQQTQDITYCAVGNFVRADNGNISWSSATLYSYTPNNTGGQQQVDYAVAEDVGPDTLVYRNDIEILGQVDGHVYGIPASPGWPNSTTYSRFQAYGGDLIMGLLLFHLLFKLARYIGGHYD